MLSCHLRTENKHIFLNSEDDFDLLVKIYEVKIPNKNPATKFSLFWKLLAMFGCVFL